MLDCHLKWWMLHRLESTQSPQQSLWCLPHRIKDVWARNDQVYCSFISLTYLSAASYSLLRHRTMSSIQTQNRIHTNKSHLISNCAFRMLWLIKTSFHAKFTNFFCVHVMCLLAYHFKNTKSLGSVSGFWPQKQTRSFFTPKWNLHCLPLARRVIYQSRLFLFSRFGDIVWTSVYHVLNVMELNIPNL